MVSVKRAPFEIQVTVTGSTPLVRRSVAQAATLALKGIPARTLRQRLKPGMSYALSVSIVGNRAMHQLNKKYRGKDRTTDVLSFSQLDHASPDFLSPQVGDVLVCLPVARAQAKQYGATLYEELQRLTVHGVLHCFGYDHETGAKDARRMFRLQKRILKQSTSHATKAK